MWNVFIQILREHIQGNASQRIEAYPPSQQSNNKYNTLSDKDQILLLHYFLCAQYPFDQKWFTAPTQSKSVANNIYCIMVCLIVNLPREARQVADYDDYDPQQLLFGETLLSDVDGS